MKELKLNAHDVRRVSVTAGVDPRSVVARLRGHRQRCTIAARIDEALRALGFTPPAALQIAPAHTTETANP